MSQHHECTICFSHFDNAQYLPKLLKCGHTFCIGCLQQTKERSQTKNVLVCAICGRETLLQNDIDGVRLLSTNYALASDPQPTCSHCRKPRNATARCRNCLVFLCEQHKVIHEHEEDGHVCAFLYAWPVPGQVRKALEEKLRSNERQASVVIKHRDQAMKEIEELQQVTFRRCQKLLEEVMWVTTEHLQQLEHQNKAVRSELEQMQVSSSPGNLRANSCDALKVIRAEPAQDKRTARPLRLVPLRKVQFRDSIPLLTLLSLLQQ